MKFFYLGVLGPSRVGFHSSFGDGSEIPEAYLEHVRDVVWANMVFNRWELGDIVMIDNYSLTWQTGTNCVWKAYSSVAI